MTNTSHTATETPKSHVVCPHCNTINRIANDDLSKQVECGQCHQNLLPGQSIALNAANFAKHTQKSDLPVVVDFWAPWCGPCRQMAPAFEQAAAQLSGKVQLAKLNTEEAQAISGQFGIRSIPTMVLFQNGKEVARQSGAMGASDIVRWANSQIK